MVTYPAPGMPVVASRRAGAGSAAWKISTSGVNFSQNFVTGEYSYDGAGNISSLGASSFLYDKLSRLTASTVYLPSWAGGSASQGYSFDDFGNITSVTGTNARSTPTSATTNRLTGSGVSYDAAGNLTCWGGTTLCNGTSYQYDKLYRMQRMITAAGPAQEDWVTSTPRTTSGSGRSR